MKLWNRMVFKSFLFDVERRQKHANNIPQKGVINQFRRHRIVISSSSSSSERESPAGSLVPAGPRGIDKLTYARFPAALIASYSTAADVTSKLYPYKDLWFGIFKRGPHVQNFGIWTILPVLECLPCTVFGLLECLPLPSVLFAFLGIFRF